MQRLEMFTLDTISAWLYHAAVKFKMASILNENNLCISEVIDRFIV